MLIRRIAELIERELAQDRAGDDVTARLLGEEGKRSCTASVLSREAGIFCGEAVCGAFQEILADAIRMSVGARDGQPLAPGDRVLELRGPVALCLSLERSLLNLLSHLCGIASLTRQYVLAVGPHRARILATRKTLPGLRELQLMAVEAGGGHVHRRSLSDGILIKDNHLACVGEKELLSRARRQRSPLHGIEIEVQSLDALPRILENPPEVIMLDNLTIDEMKRAIALIGGRSRIEASGGITLDEVSAIAELGVDYISVGRLTHSVRALDLTLDILH